MMAMSRVSSAAVAAALAPDSKAPESLYRQLYDKLRHAILAGRFSAGQQMPSTRILAADLEVSRNTVLNAFEQLIAEGYLEGAVGSGTYVARALPEEMLRATATHAGAGAAGKRRRWSRQGARLAMYTISRIRQAVVPKPFQSGVPALDAFPFDLWARLLNRYWRKQPGELLGYGDSGGYMPLRRAIASYLAVARAVRCKPEQVIVVSGAQQALDLTARLLLEPGDAVWFEDPGYLGARATMNAAGARLVPIAVDEDGLSVRRGIARKPRARMVYVTPSHQFPLGVTMSLGRRLELLSWAQKAGAWILEDDYDSEYRYASRPLASMQGLDRGGRVIYFGTFSKVLFPALRLGYLVVPPDLVEGFLVAKAVTDRQSPTIEQAVLAEFIDEGHFGRHIRRMRALYLERVGVLVGSVEKELKGFLEMSLPEAGMHTIGRLQKGSNDRELARRAAAAGVTTLPLSAFYLGSGGKPGLVLGYSGYDNKAIREGVRKLAQALLG
jgi:GntR family transcriptional regulator/MocR family aminotransferase